MTLTPDRHSIMICDPEGNIIHVFGPHEVDAGA